MVAKATQLSVPEVGPDTAERLASKLRHYAANKTLIVGVSGGVDSATTLALCVRAVGPSGVFGLVLPDSRTTPPQDVEDAKVLLGSFGVNYAQHTIDGVVDAFARELSIVDRKLLGNVKARVRMTILYYYANRINGIVVGTGDRSELLLGYFTKYGDGGVDVLPLGSLYKTQVRQLGKILGVPPNIADKPSSPALWLGQTAETELGLKYEVADVILYALTELGYGAEELVELGMNKGAVEKVVELMKTSGHKRSLPPILA